MKRLMIAAALLCWAVPAVAQQTPNEQALGAKLMQEIGENVQLRASLIAAETKLKAHDDEAKRKAAEATPPPPKK